MKKNSIKMNKCNIADTIRIDIEHGERRPSKLILWSTEKETGCVVSLDPGRIEWLKEQLDRFMTFPE